MTRNTKAQKCGISYCRVYLPKEPRVVFLPGPDGTKKKMELCNFHADCWGDNPAALAEHLRKGYNPENSLKRVLSERARA